MYAASVSYMTRIDANRAEQTDIAIGTLDRKISFSIAALDKKATDLNNATNQKVDALDKKTNDTMAATNKAVATLDTKTGVAIIGSSTDLINSGKFVALDNTKILITSNNIEMINSDNKWLYDNRISTNNVFTILTSYDINNLTDNLATTSNIYISPYSISLPVTTLPLMKMLYYKDFT